MNGAFIAMQATMQASAAAMRNAMHANQSAYKPVHTEMVNSYANCQTVNPMGAKMCASCKNYDAQNYWCNLLEQPAASATMNGSACYRYRNWELNIDQSLKKCCCEPMQTNEEKAFSQAIARELETMAARRWTFEKQERKIKFTPIPSEVFAHLCGEPYKPTKPRLTFDDLYNLAFPFDPIQEHFAGVYKRINAEHEKRMEILDRIDVKPVKRVEPVEVLDKPKQKKKNQKVEAIKEFLVGEIVVSAVVAIALAFIWRIGPKTIVVIKNEYEMNIFTEAAVETWLISVAIWTVINLLLTIFVEDE